MGKKNNIVFNLTIDDLKELGIIKRKRQRRKTPQRIMKYIQQPNNIKSVSDHMTGYSNVFNNANTSNLQTENLRLQNNLLEKYPMIKNETNNNFESRFKAIENENKENQDLTQYILQSAYGGEFNYRPMITQTGLRQPQVEQLDDNDDVPETGGSNLFKSYKADYDNSDNIDIHSTLTEKSTGIRQPENPNDSTFNDVDSEYEEDSVDEASTLAEAEAEAEAEPEPEPESEAMKIAKAELSAAALKKQKNKEAYERHLANVNALKAEYTKLKGKDIQVLKSKTVKVLKEAINKLKSKK